MRLIDRWFQNTQTFARTWPTPSKNWIWKNQVFSSKVPKYFKRETQSKCNFHIYSTVGHLKTRSVGSNPRGMTLQHRQTIKKRTFQMVKPESILTDFLNKNSFFRVAIMNDAPLLWAGQRDVSDFHHYFHVLESWETSQTLKRSRQIIIKTWDKQH